MLNSTIHGPIVSGKRPVTRSVSVRLKAAGHHRTPRDYHKTSHGLLIISS